MTALGAGLIDPVKPGIVVFQARASARELRRAGIGAAPGIHLLQQRIGLLAENGLLGWIGEVGILCRLLRWLAIQTQRIAIERIGLLTLLGIRREQIVTLVIKLVSLIITRCQRSRGLLIGRLDRLSSGRAGQILEEPDFSLL